MPYHFHPQATARSASAAPANRQGTPTITIFSKLILSSSDFPKCFQCAGAHADLGIGAVPVNVSAKHTGNSPALAGDRVGFVAQSTSDIGRQAFNVLIDNYLDAKDKTAAGAFGIRFALLQRSIPSISRYTVTGS